MKAKTIAFILMMGALGTVLFAISYSLGQIAPSVALDFSLIGAFIAGFYGGPLVGFTSGLFVGILPGFVFGPLGMGGLLGLIGLPFGKSLSGVTSGFIGRSLRIGQGQQKSIIGIPATLLAYIPEGLFTWIYFMILNGPESGSAVFLTFILPKAVLEVSIISVLMAALMGNKGFSDFVCARFARSCPKGKRV